MIFLWFQPILYLTLYSSPHSRVFIMSFPNSYQFFSSKEFHTDLIPTICPINPVIYSEHKVDVFKPPISSPLLLLRHSRNIIVCSFGKFLRIIKVVIIFLLSSNTRMKTFFFLCLHRKQEKYSVIFTSFDYCTFIPFIVSHSRIIFAIKFFPIHTASKSLKRSRMISLRFSCRIYCHQYKYNNFNAPS